MILAAPLILPFAQVAGITAGGLGMIGLTKKVSDYIRQNPEKSEEIIKLISPSAAGISTLFENKKRGIGDNNPPSPIEEEKPPQKKPPKDSDILSELVELKTTEKLEKEVKKLEDKAFAKFQYMANKEGGQTAGNREILVDLDKDLFNKYLKDKTVFKNFKEFEKVFPGQSIKLFKRADQKEYQITKVGEVGKDFFPDEENPYKIEVEDFDSEKAIKQSKTFDSDVYPIKKAIGGLIDKPLSGKSRDI